MAGPQYPQYQQQPVPSGEYRERPELNAGRIWTTGVLTGVVAAICNLVVYLFAREVFDVSLVVPEAGSDVYEELQIWQVIVASFVPAILATGLLHLLLRFVPNPLAFFALICLGVLLISLIPPLSLDAPATASTKVSLIVMHLVAGVVIMGLLGGTVDRFYDRRVPGTPGPAGGAYA